MSYFLKYANGHVVKRDLPSVTTHSVLSEPRFPECASRSSIIYMFDIKIYKDTINYLIAVNIPIRNLEKLCR